MDLADLSDAQNAGLLDYAIRSVQQQAIKIPLNMTGKCINRYCQKELEELPGLPKTRRWCDGECRDTDMEHN